MRSKPFLLMSIVVGMAIITATVNAGIVVDVIGVPGDGYSIYNGGKTIMPNGTPMFTVGLQIWATVSGNNDIATDDGIQALTGGIALSNSNPPAGMTGALRLASESAPFGYASPFDTDTTKPNETDTLLGLAGATSGDQLVFRASSMQMNTILGQSYLLGSFNCLVTPNYGGGGVISTINYVKPGANIAAATFKIDNVSKNGVAANLDLIMVGVPVSVVILPEPSTIILLGMGALALVFVRRRK